jgi:hypothetical protein
MTSPAQLKHYIMGAWIEAARPPIASYNPAPPSGMLAQGLCTGTADANSSMNIGCGRRKQASPAKALFHSATTVHSRGGNPALRPASGTSFPVASTQHDGVLV